jgi:hypothetical protein
MCTPHLAASTLSFANSRLATFALVGALLAACSSTSADAGGDGGSVAPGTGAYGDLAGTFKVAADGVDVTISGAVVGTYENLTTQWNGEASPDLAASNGVPKPLIVTGTLPSGDTAALVVNLANITTKPASGTFNCMEIGAYQLNIVFQLFPKGSITAVKEWAPGASLSACTMKLETPTAVTETTSDGLTNTVYLAHGSLSAKLDNSPIGDMKSDGSSGELSLTW